MSMKARGLGGLIAMVVLGLALAGAPMAQTTTKSDVLTFEVLSVDGNFLVFHDQKGTHGLNVPNDFRFTVDGKKLSVSELKPGMKGTAVVTTTTTLVPVYATEVREATVLQAGPGSIIVRDKDGVRKRFTQDQLDKWKIQILKDGRSMRIGEVKEGDVITATILSPVAPVAVTEQDVRASLDKSAPPPAMAAPGAPAAPTPAPAAGTTTTAPAAAPAAAPTAAPATAPSAAPTTAPPVSSAAPPPAGSGMGMTGYVLIAIIIALVLFFVMRGRRKSP